MTTHRFTLRREWDPKELGILNFIMLNPSTADDEKDDATICAWGDNAEMLPHRDLDVIARLRYRDLLCIRKSVKGNPVHPVREPYRDTPEILFSALG